MDIWKKYTNRINRNCGGLGNVKDMDYWRNNLFAGTIIYLLPFCLIALVPGIYMCLVTQEYILAIIDILITLGVVLIAFVPGFSLLTRKVIFFSFVMILSCAMLLSIGMSGPGMLYLFAGSIFSILIFPTAYSYWPAWIITGICILFTFAIYFGVIELPNQNLSSASVWVAVTSNLVFLSFLLAALVPRLFKGLQETLTKEKDLKEVLSKQHDELQQALKLVQQKNKELEQFAYLASHDLQEPLRMVTSFMGLLKNKYGGHLDETAHLYINFAVDGGKRMQKMISDLLDLSRTARQDGNKELVDFNDLVKDVKQNISRLIEENQVEILVKTPLPILPVFRSEISSVFQNLLSNAIKFRKKEISTVISISAIEMETSWLFTVEDNGIGIEKEKFEKIFEIFTRLHSQEIYEGSGIGLAICKKVIEHHGGEIWVESKEEKGSVFYFTIIK